MSIPAGRPRRAAEKTEAGKSNSDDEFDFDGLLKELRTSLEVRRREEEQLQREIGEILDTSSSAGSDLSRCFSLAVSRLNNQLLVAEAETQQLAHSVGTVGRLAENISGKVRSLDVAKTRVVECLQLAGDMRDLGTCSEGVDDAIREENYEQAAQHIHRFLTLDKAVFQLRGGAENDKETGQSVRHSYDVLQAAAARLKDTFEKRLRAAIEGADVAAMQRFVKLFPLIGEPDIGLEMFGKHVAGEITKLGEDNIKIMQAGGTDDSRRNVLYADTLFLFFEGIAGILETNQPLIENSYGPDKLLDFIQLLQNKIDVIAGRVLDEFARKRQWTDKSKQIDRHMRFPDREGDVGVDPLEVDVLLSEVCAMHTRAEMYWRFVRRRLQAGAAATVQEDDDDVDEETRRKKREEAEKRRAERERKLDGLLNRSSLGSRMQELMGRYILMEQYYMSESVQKAIAMDQKEDGLTSSSVEDVLFVVRKSARRSLAAASVDCACATLNNAGAVVDEWYGKHLENIIKAGYPSGGFAAEALQTAATAYNVLQHGKTVAESSSDAQRDSFLLALNNARATGELAGQVKKALATEADRMQFSPSDSAKLSSALCQLDELSTRMTQLASQAVSALVSALFRPKIKTACESYLDLSHSLSDQLFADYEAADPWVEGFNAQVDSMLAHFERLVDAESYQELLLCVCSEVVRQWERVIFKCSFNRLGGLQLDKEFRQLTGYLSGVAGWSARERTNRLSQIVHLLNVDSIEEAVEVFEAQRATQLSRTLTASEVKKVLALRVDLSAAHIQALQI